MTPPSKKEPKAFTFPIPIDPLRILYGIRERWIWFCILPFVFAVAGFIVGAIKSQDRYSVSLQLIKSEVPTTIQTNEAGKAFKPRDLSDDTLLSTTYSTEVLNRTGARLVPSRSANDVKSMVKIAKLRDTSLFYLTAHSRVSADAAIELVSVWADEVIRFTNNLQKEEARQMEAFISERLDSIETQLAQVNQQILDFAKDYDFVDVDKQTESSLSSLENLRMSLANSQIELKYKGVQIARYRDELRTQSPLEADLKKKREELTFLRGRYTDQNPLVEEKLYEIEFIEKEIKVMDNSPVEDLKNFTGSALGNNLYLEIISLENERSQLEGLVDSFELRLAEQRKLVSDLPEKALRLSELKNSRNLLINAQSLLDSRRKEASFYETKAPGYWRIFQTPNTNEVVHSSQNIKAMVLGALGMLTGLALATFAAFISEFIRTGLRSPLEASIATSTLPLFRFTTKDASHESWLFTHLFRQREAELNVPLTRAFWLTQTAAGTEQVLNRFLFAHTGKSADEIVFWNCLLDQIQAEGRSVVFCNLDVDSSLQSSGLQEHPAIISWLSSLQEMPSNDSNVVIVRLNKIPAAHEVADLLKLNTYYLLSSPSLADRSETRHISGILRKLLGPANGMLILDHSPGKTLPRLLNGMEMMVLGVLSNQAAPTKTTE